MVGHEHGHLAVGALIADRPVRGLHHATDAHDAHPRPKGPAATNRDEYVRRHRSTSNRSGHARSSSTSRKCPVAVHTGSATNPDVGGVPAATGTSTVTAGRSATNATGSNPARVAAASNAAENAAASTTTRPSPVTVPSASTNACRTIFTNASSFA